MKEKTMLCLVIVVLMIFSSFGVVNNIKAEYGDILEEFPAPRNQDYDSWAKGLAWNFDNGQLYSSDNNPSIYQDGIYKIDPNNGNWERFDNTWIIGSGWLGLAYDGNGNIWCVADPAGQGNNGWFYKFDLDDWPEFGTYENNFEKEFQCSEIGNPFGLAYGDGSLWCSDENNNKIYEINPSTGNVVDNFDLDNIYYGIDDRHAKGLAWDDGYLWIALDHYDDGVLSKIIMLDMDEMSVVTEMEFDGSAQGLAFDGIDLWVIDKDDDLIKKVEVGKTDIAFVLAFENSGTIIFDSNEFYSGDSTERFKGSYSLSANIADDWSFDRWGKAGNCIIEDPLSPNTNVQIYPTGLLIITLFCENNLPNVPSTPTSDKTHGYHNIDVFEFSTSSTDPEGSDLKYGWDWDKDDLADYWTEYYNSGETVTIPHVFEEPGTFNVRVKAADNQWPFSSDYSQSLTVQIDNLAPNTPQTPSGGPDGGSGFTDTTYTFISSGTDDNLDKLRYGWDWDGDGTVDNIAEWALPADSASGATVNKDHKWNNPGIYDVRVKTKDQYGDVSGWSESLTITIEEKPNNPPTVPDTPTRYDTKPLVMGEDLRFRTKSTDADGHKVSYGWDWDGDMIVDEWTKLERQDKEIVTAHIFDSDGIFDIRVKAKDEKDVESGWSAPLTVNIEFNSAPQISLFEGGPNNGVGKKGEDYEFHSKASDAEGDELYFKFDWDDGPVEELGPRNSNQDYYDEHRWYSEGSYTVRLKVVDEHGLSSSWSEITVEMPRINPAISNLIHRLIEMFPILKILFNF